MTQHKGMSPADVLADNVTPNAPERIWLQVDATGDAEDRSEPLSPEHWDQLTWCAESVGGVEVEYVRADKVAALVERFNAVERERDALREALQKLLEAADDSNGMCYGTLGTGFVRSIASAALAGAGQ